MVPRGGVDYDNDNGKEFGRDTTARLRASALGGADDAMNAAAATSPSKYTSLSSSSSSSSWDRGWELAKSRLLKISNIASALCVLDCTILPAVTVLLPLVGMATTPAQSRWLHELGHSVALFFVLPVGGLAAFLNYLSHRRTAVSFPALLGLCFVYAANAPHGYPIVSLLPHGLAHALHCGSWVHRFTNLLGCALLLGSNYVSHKMGCASSGLMGMAGKDCGHDHDHSHSHDRGGDCCK